MLGKNKKKLNENNFQKFTPSHFVVHVKLKHVSEHVQDTDWFSLMTYSWSRPIKQRGEKAHFAHCTGFTLRLTTDKDMYI